jgi:hypothetical protein
MERIAIATALAFAAMLPVAPAQAQNARSFVSGHGLDTNTCTLAAPCRTFAVAYTKTNAGGEIDVLDTAGYGALTIDHAISIVNEGSIASVLVPSGGTGIGILINAGASDAVSLRGLTIEGAGSGVIGIQFNSGKSLTIENCVIRHVVNDGIEFDPNSASSLSISNSVVSDNGLSGIVVAPTGSGAVTAVFNRVEVNNNAYQGIFLEGDNGTGTLKGTVYDSVAAHNVNAIGFLASSASGHSPTTLTVVHSVAADNAYGVLASGVGATLRVAHSTVTGNTNGWFAQFSGVVLSAGDNTIEGNVANETAPTTYSQK